MAEEQPQPTPASPSHRPKIGVVLSGGGARGAAHVGLLKVLEREHIPIDYIVGTSMGAIVAGLYAYGFSADELDRFIQRIDWIDSFQDDPTRNEKSWRRKQEDKELKIKRSIGFNNFEFQLPKGAIQGQKQMTLLRGFTRGAEHLDSFDNMRIPFRAVASDINTGEAYVFDKGDLALAIRASMSVPAVFAPTEYDGKLLTDGGIADNIPIDVARKMGADIVIVSDIGTPMLKPEEIKSLVDVSSQLSTLLVRVNSEKQLATLTEQDILIQPDLGDIGSGSFERTGEAIKLGQKYSEMQVDRLRQLALPPDQNLPQENKERNLYANRAPKIIIRDIQVKSDAPIASKLIRTQIQQKPGEVFDRHVIEKDVANVYGLGYFELVTYRLIPVSATESDLEISAKRKSWGPNYMKFGLNLSDDFEGHSAFNLSVNYTLTNLNRWGAEWINSAQMGDRPRLATELYLPLPNYNQYYVAPSAEYERRTVTLYKYGEAYASIRLHTAATGFAIGRELGNWGDIRTGVYRANVTYDTLVGLEQDVQAQENNVAFVKNGYYFLNASIDTLDNPFFPAEGSSAGIEWRWARDHLGAESEYRTIEFRTLKALNWGDNHFLMSLDGGSLRAGELPIQESFTLGGFWRLSGLSEEEMVGNHFALGKLIYFNNLTGPLARSAGYPLYAGMSVETGGVWQEQHDVSERDVVWSGSLFVATDIFLGPMYFAYGLTEGGRSAVHFYLGQKF